MGRKKINIKEKYCEICNIAIKRGTRSNEKRISAIQYLRARFCSKKCRGISLKNLFLGEKNPNYKGGNSKCLDCKKDLGYRYFFRTKISRCKKCNFIFRKGENSPNYKGGKDFPNCINCNTKTGDFKSVYCRNCYRGILHPQWKGGISPIQNLIRGIPENRQWIKQCLFRDNYECLKCGIKSNGRNLQVHHIKQFAQILLENKINSIENAKQCKELWNIDNGETLCRDCHKLKKNFNKKLL